MPTDHTRGGGSGPRHAAPRKPLLARLNMPAGKAVALAAMPGAVLMGMGLTPTLAQAKPVQPVNPFGDAGCVTAPDTVPEPDATENGTPSPAPSAASPGTGADAKERPGAGERPSAPAGRGQGPADSPSAAPSASASASASPSAKTAPVPERVPAPLSSPPKKVNPLDPLGLGEKLTEILTGGKPAAAPGPSAPSSPSPSPSSSPSAQGASPKQRPKPDKAVSGPTAEAKPSAPATPSPSASASQSPSPSPTGEAGGKQPGPCPKGTVVDENEHRAFPGQPWYLEASKLTLTGLTYEGVKRITMANGQQKPVLKFTADALEIRDLHQIVNGQGKQYHVAGMGTTSTLKGGKVTMYTEELKGNLLGIVPSTQSPTSLPPLIPGLKLPIPIFFTHVRIRQAGQFGGTLHIPNLHQYLTDGTYP
ncbi:hypothetical protein [Streptomyces sp. UNOB3_S3]|uniref:hypothetical protein n=1 Tax=Streptomyces sp. UNOB3_S3 TaxID=2871682 RepID=UPI001E38D19D|nr:hypothetical protein [Streptomyces sp. UNOB3_S3]